MRSQVAHVLDELGGVATRRELEWAGVHPELVSLALATGRIWRVRRGLYVSVGTSSALIQALRIGGRLACVSALQHFGEPVAPDERLHVEVTANASRLRMEGGVVIHWTRRPLEGSRAVVDRMVARRQAAACRALRPLSL